MPPVPTKEWDRDSFKRTAERRTGNASARPRAPIRTRDSTDEEVDILGCCSIHSINAPLSARL